MLSSMIYHFIVRLMLLTFAVCVAVRMVRTRDWRDQLAAGLLLIPFLLRALGGK